MPELFLSYARDDQHVARRFAEGFEREGLGVWWDQALNPGEAFDQVTEQALAEAGAVVVLWSKSSVSSRWVRAEATQANASNRLLPVMIEPCTRPIMFELTHTADLSHWKGNTDDPAWRAFIAGVRRFLARHPHDNTQLPARVAGAGRQRVCARERLAAVGQALQGSVVQTGSLLRRFGGRLAFALAGALVAGLITWQMRPQATRDITRFSIELPSGVANGFAISPDGRRIVFTSGNQLWSRRLDQDEATPLPGSEGAVLPFFSPDGRSVGFFTIGADASSNQLKAFDFRDEAVRVLVGFRDIPGVMGRWDRRGQIFFGQVTNESLFRVASVGGTPERVVQRGDYAAVAWQEPLPDGQWVLFNGVSAQGSFSEADIVAQHLGSGERKVVVKRGHAPMYLPTGHLLFARGGALYAVAFDARRLETRGREVPMVQDLETNEANGFAPYSVSANGTLVYVSGSPLGMSGGQSLVSVDESGKTSAISTEPRRYSTPRVSPDGSKVALEVTGSDRRRHIWMMDMATGGATQLTFDGEEDRYPVWTSDSRDVLYVARHDRTHAIWRKAADGTGEARRLIGGTDALVPTDVHGSLLVYQDRGAGEERDLFVLDLAGDGKPQPLLSTPDDEAGARVSPDGAWVAYVSTPLGGATPDRRVFVRPFPRPSTGGQRAISEGLGSGPVWSARGDEIYYMMASGSIPLMAARVSITPTTITPTARRELFSLQSRFDMTRTGSTLGYGAVYDVIPGGGFVAVLNEPLDAAEDNTSNPSRPRLRVVMNWFEELGRLVPVD